MRKLFFPYSVSVVVVVCEVTWIWSYPLFTVWVRVVDPNFAELRVERSDTEPEGVLWGLIISENVETPVWLNDRVRLVN